MKFHIRTIGVIVSSLIFLGACENSSLSASAKGTISKPITTVTELHADESDEGLDEFERGARTLALTGDLDAMLERGYIRVLVPYSKTFFFYEGARPRGLAYAFMEAFAENLRKTHGGKSVKLMMVYLPMSRDRLIPGIVEGLGDIALAGLTATEERKKLVVFVINSNSPVSEIIVTGPDAPRLESVEDLSGERVFVRTSSSYYESLQALKNPAGVISLCQPCICWQQDRATGSRAA